jgi:methylated-DNA-[protein]-cysteine S-methyltransferase
MELQKAYYNSPTGTIEVTGTEKGIETLYFVDEMPEQSETPTCLQECMRQLDLYFKGELEEFDLKLIPAGTDFQQKVWKELLTVGFGKTASYLDIAKALGDKNATRAVGSANGQNPISVIIPCHRIIGSNGKLTGYGGGIERKRWLLDFERGSHQGTLF